MPNLVRFEPAMPSPAVRIRLIERSLRCFALGSFSLIPLIGLPLAVLAILLHFQVWAESEKEWNPARRYLFAGFYLAWFGALVSLGALALFVLVLIDALDF
jgi:hypothetical protein